MFQYQVIDSFFRHGWLPAKKYFVKKENLVQ